MKSSLAEFTWHNFRIYPISNLTPPSAKSNLALRLRTGKFVAFKPSNVKSSIRVVRNRKFPGQLSIVVNFHVNRAAIGKLGVWIGNVLASFNLLNETLSLHCYVFSANGASGSHKFL